MKYRRARLKSEVSYSGKDFICRKTHDKKKEEVRPKISGEKNVSTKLFMIIGCSSHKKRKKKAKKGVKKKRSEKEGERFFAAAAEKKNEKNSNLQRTAPRSSFLFHITHLSLTHTLLLPFV